MREQEAKMKKLLLLIIIVLLAITTVSATICEDQTEIGNIPCEVITPTLNCTDYVYNLTNISGGNLLIINGSMSPIGNGTYNFTFNQPLGSYQITLCDTTTGTIEIVPNTSLSKLLWFILLIIAPTVFFIIGTLREDWVFIFLAAIILIVAGVYLFITPLGISDLMDKIIAFLFFGLGAYLIIRTSINILGGVE
jgi:hypothetical protein